MVHNGALSLVVRTSSALPSDFGEAMPVLFEVPLDPARLEAWDRVLGAVGGADVVEFFAPFLPPEHTHARVAVEVRGVAGAFCTLPSMEDSDRLLGHVPGEDRLRFRLLSNGHHVQRMALETREVRLHVSEQGLQWVADLTDVEEQVVLRTSRLGSVELLEMRLQIAPPQGQHEIFRRLALLDPRRASLLLSWGLPDPWSPDPSARRPLEPLPMRVLLPLLRHEDAEVRSRAARALDLPSGPG